MKQYGFYKVRAIAPEVNIADPDYNCKKIIEAVGKAEEDNVDCVVFPELSVTAYTCADLFQQELLMDKAEESLRKLVSSLASTDLIFAVGCPVMALGKRFNCAVVACKGKILGIVPKSYLPNYGEFYEKRWFESGKDIRNVTINFAGFEVPFGIDLIFSHKGVKIGVEICEDLWVPQPPSCFLTMHGAEVILNLSASDDLIGKHDYLLSLISQQSARCRCVYVYSSAGWGESSTDLVFTGKTIIGNDGKIKEGDNRFSTFTIEETDVVDIEKLRLDRARFNTFTEAFTQNVIRLIEASSDNEEKTILPTDVDPYPFVPSEAKELNQRCNEIINIQAYGLMKRLHAIGCKKVIVGISGGLDSTLALLVTVRAFDSLGMDRKGIIAITMPGLATTSRTKTNATHLMEVLRVTSLEIPIEKSVTQHFLDIGQDPKNYDVTFENSQARERTQILMDVANKENGIVVGTGDMSELALGWCTYNGDQMSMYGVNASVPKTLVRHLVNWFAGNADESTGNILRDICDTPISPELVPSASDEITQKTEDLVGPYELHDFFLYHFLRNSFAPKKILALAEIAFKEKYDSIVIKKWLKNFLKRFFSQQFKRSCMPDGPKVGSISLSPRGDWRMPSDATVKMWIDEIGS